MEDLFKDFPFKCTLSFKPLIDFWLSPFSLGNSSQSCLAAGLAEQIARAPELSESIEDLEIIRTHMPIIRGLLTAVFPPALWEAEPMAVVVPFCMKPVVSSPAFQRLFLDEDGSFKGEILVGKEVFFKGRIARAYLRILREFYGVEENLDFPIVCRLEDPDTGLDRYFRLQLNPRFVEITPVADLPPLSEEDKLRVLENLNHPEVLRDILPP